MSNFEISFKNTMAHEGGYVNDPDDPGGETYKGVSRKNWPKWEGWMYVDNMKNHKDFPEILDKNGTLQVFVKDFYKKNFWDKLKAEEIKPQAVADSVFDFAVNAGIGNCVKYMQEIISAKVDGFVGAETLFLLNNWNEEYFLAAFNNAKARHYLKIVKEKPYKRKYLYAWLSRAFGS